jgi:YVTN family beta-propeller protein
MKSKIRAMRYIFSISLAGIFTVINAQASQGDLLKEFDLAPNAFAADKNHNLIYVSLPNSNSVTILDMNQLTQLDTIFVGSSPEGMAISRDGNQLYVALVGSSSLAVIDLRNNTLLDPIPLPFPAQDVAVDHKGRVYATPSSSSNRTIMVYDPITDAVSQPFPSYCSICYSTTFEMNQAGTMLFAANLGLSPGTIAKYDVSGDVPVLVWQNGHGDLGSSYGQDLWLDQLNEHVYYAVFGGNGVTAAYDIAQIDANNMSILGAFATGANPREIVTSPDGEVAYAVHTSGHIDVWDAESFMKIREYPVTGEASELFVDRSGNYLIAAFTNSLRIYEAEGSAPLVDDDFDGVDDLADNCPGLSNPAQLDTDGDGIGYLCDPFPNHPNNDIAQCEMDRDDASNQLDNCLSTPKFTDQDGDGEFDGTDKCAYTPSGEPVDDSGCSIAQFCARFTSSKTCGMGDWNNDEPVDSPYDCRANIVDRKFVSCSPR